ncbi:metal-dependent transcriptional regulator [Tenacibaculum mesophilum]|uniref:Transcriptional regulator MntR n=1 Tax=Tenacibaculum mesophilum TaxID=104268 RepID=A0AAE9MQJ6_9FLAO|nr:MULTISPECIES: metal-dependent transcriptional regulator [Tenacibaculum]MCO7184467.1 metal-dependent transcriptional regulator [Tenacibaculum sp. XPcli2-G]UTD15965.1 metal-dependent transcriptional regulator [Tenacibaculum mesophilum]GFD71553.1 iron-dependent repressor [Tenacibaculum sp. KUL113]|eukprot:TRINITY_DN3666_c0_g3_i1.p1 TRINITY_DN3666_c0_g3~~TRINITY_DN3666_c0_g3_i1.p1  ORF type:complete len:220 (-),score=47.70 TRINITY_DN3666_c0_g3_i1:6-665(-)
MFSQSEENYIKTMYHLAADYKKGISTNAIAKKLDTKASSVTDMIKKLSEKDVVAYKKYQGVTLTDFGKKIAANIVRKHRLWEVFLVDKLNFSWDEVHEVAEQLEHIKSPKLINELDAFLDYPKRDPHGDPIPDKEGNLQIIEKSLLSTLKKNEIGVCVGVDDSSSEFLRFLDKQEIALGKQIKVVEKEPFDGSLVIEMDGKTLTVSNKIASNLYIQKPR